MSVTWPAIPPGSGVERALGPSAGHVAVLADVGAHDGLAVVVVAVETAEAEGGVEVPRFLAAAEDAVDGYGGAAHVPERAAHLGAGEVVEHAAEDHVLAALLGVHAPGPVAEVQLVAAEAAGQELVPLLPAQRPGPRRQVRAHRAQPPPRVPTAPGHHAAPGDALAGCIGGGGFVLFLHLADRRRGRGRGGVRGRGRRRDLRLGRAVVGRVQVQVVVERPRGPRGGVAGVAGAVCERGNGGGRNVATAVARRGRGLEPLDGGGVVCRGGGAEGDVGPDVELEAEVVGGLEEHAGAEKARAADGELVQRGPGRGRPVGGRRREQLRGERPRQARREAGGAEQRGEARGRARRPRPVPRVALEPPQDLEQHVVRQRRQRRRRLGPGPRARRPLGRARAPALLRLVPAHGMGGWRPAARSRWKFRGDGRRPECLMPLYYPFFFPSPFFRWGLMLFG
ncbi:hypothetical protein PAHAL_3G311200 [Panicum hallii]|uniref:Uncharacterized protein n=1 Tax=Panicum hallii TaxID=206008 RepID=A0A2T8KJZ4_9POAL|nr:hypothetical protein PAHAL_3G311200 [Panicum hallii]